MTQKGHFKVVFLETLENCGREWIVSLSFMNWLSCFLCSCCPDLFLLCNHLWFKMVDLKFCLSFDSLRSSAGCRKSGCERCWESYVSLLQLAYIKIIWTVETHYWASCPALWSVRLGWRWDHISNQFPGDADTVNTRTMPGKLLQIQRGKARNIHKILPQTGLLMVLPNWILSWCSGKDVTRYWSHCGWLERTHLSVFRGVWRQ